MPSLDRSWGRAMIACAATFISGAVHSNTGFFYVEFIREYSLSRERASWLTSVSQAMTEGSALIAVALQNKFAISTIGLIGSVLYWSGIVASQWAPNILWMTFTFGLVQGAGSGIVAVAVTVLLMRYFDKYRATATGIRYAGYSLASLIYPPLLSQLEAVFSFRQMFLLLGAISLNVTPLVYALKEPALSRKSLYVKKRRLCKISEDKTGAGALNVRSSLEESAHDTNRVAPSLVAGTDDRVFEKRSSTDSNSTSEISVRNALAVSRGNEMCSQSLSVISRMPAQHNNDHKKNAVKVNANSQEGAWDKHQNPLPLATLLLRPVYWVVVFGAVLADYSEYVFLATIVDSALDRGATRFQADMSIVCSAPSQIFGRTVLPFLADVGFVSRTVLAGACYCLFAASIALLGFTRTFSAYAACAAVAWISLGSLTAMKHVVAADHFGIEAVPAAWATTGIFVVPMLFCSPSILGFFRDKHGSYNSLYYSLAGLHFTAAVFFLLLRWSTLNQKKSWIIEHQEKNPGAAKRSELSFPNECT